ncbi:dTMP kinase [Mucilaginibacter gotjawali]|uniref:dTMP kinase n=2 Tax=Mucilaginibacter gotjawali TaxID=1550579 RepID=A0A839SIE4_9SPHI|nr:dTMP kinase [Mucilaginibacter gotjawali]MBB3056287.1 dTMP kinase [Mucilaginibacter gotjawali]BAU54991.1 Thymidylate kinase [Mucilaginibacter gotjawali]
MKKNLFIAFEGIDGSGKSTQVKLLKDKLEQAGLKVYTTCEPTESPIGKIIRDIFTHKMEADHRVIAGLFVADRLDHLLNKTNGIIKMLEEGYTVITDRYYFSSYAYQSTHMDLNWVIQANSLSANLLKPDVNVFIDITPEQSMERLKKGRTSIELYETLENLQNVRNKYFEVMELLQSVEEIFKTNGNRDAETISNEIWNNLERRFN